MIRRRGHGHEEEESSSDDEEDAFSALSKKGNAKKKAKSGPSSTSSIARVQPSASSSSGVQPPAVASLSSSALPPGAPVSLTSSMKRHHKPSDARKAKMDALLQELEAEKDQIPNRQRKRFVPEKKGSFVDPGEEHLTSNLFVGNLAPSIAEEDLSNLFSQFGELYSVKIMWPRTMEERNRNRNTGFVCFMNRDDAEEAMAACDETDPFNNGRLLTLRWGKNVKKVRREESSAKPSSSQRRNQGGLDSNRGRQDLKAPPSSSTSFDKLTEGSTSVSLPTIDGKQMTGRNEIPETPEYNPEIHAARAIRVEIPSDSSRFHFISTTASYVAKDPEIEQRLRDEETGNSQFDFIMPWSDNDNQEKEKLFYRWRVYSFCQGDTYSIWRTKPFLMFPNGRFWLPPPLDVDAANREKATVAEQERRHRQQKEERANRELMTGRQFERRKRRGEFGANSSKLNAEELDRFDVLVRRKLSLSRKTICEAMSFCFDNCIAAKEVSSLLKEAILDESDHVSNNTRIARLYLLSDILFNSQQPGVRNAFMYRTTIESMAVDVFRDLGGVVRRKERKSGRITVNKLRKAVSAVLGAWTEWGVYNVTFVDELEAHFDGREVTNDTSDEKIDLDASAEKEKDLESEKDEDDVVIHGPRGDWKEVSGESNETKQDINTATNITIEQSPDDTTGKSGTSQTTNESKNQKQKDQNRNSSYTDDIELHPKESNSEGVGSEGIDTKGIDGEGIDGEDLDGEDLDGEDLDGEDLDGEDLDGEDLDGEDLDGEDLDVDDLDVEDLGGAYIDGKDLDGADVDGKSPL